jgi:hypothetical protein
MNVSSPAIPRTIRISRVRLVGIFAAAVAAAVTSLILALTVGAGSPARPTPALGSEVPTRVDPASPIAQLPIAYGAEAGWGTGYGRHPERGNPIAQLPIAFGAEGGWQTGYTGTP